MSAPVSPMLSQPQLAVLREHGEERPAAAGEVLFSVGDRRYPFIAILEGEAAVLDAAGEDRPAWPLGFPRRAQSPSGQTVYLTAVATEPMRYIAVDRDVLRALLFEEGALGDLLLSTFIARREALESRQGIGVEIVGPRRSQPTRSLVGYVRRMRLPHTWRDSDDPEDPGAAALVEPLAPDEVPLVRLPGDVELLNPTGGEVSRALGIGLELDAREQVDLAILGGGPAGLGAAVYGASEGLKTLVIDRSALGGQAGASRRIENYLGFPAGISGTELTARAITQARKFGARTATALASWAAATRPRRPRSG